MIPRATKQSFKVTMIKVDGKDKHAYSLYLEFPEVNPMSSFGPRGQVLDQDLVHFIEITQTAEDQWMWGHGAQSKSEDPAMAILWSEVYKTLDEAVYETNIYLLLWALKANLFTLWVKNDVPCYIDTAPHATEFTDESVIDFIATGQWAPIEGKEGDEAIHSELKQAVRKFDDYVRYGIFLKDCGVMTGLVIDNNPYKKRLLQDFAALALRREEQYK